MHTWSCEINRKKCIPLNLLSFNMHYLVWSVSVMCRVGVFKTPTEDLYTPLIESAVISLHTHTHTHTHISVVLTQPIVLDVLYMSYRSIQNQYDEYREKYRLFDRALFCLPPEHKLRRFCRAVLTKQLHGPTARPENLLSTEAILYVFQ